MTEGRLLPLTSHSSSANMAIDEAISLSVATQAQPPTLRFYQWTQPTLSLGYFQSIANAESYLNELGHESSVVIVRRSTGGGAILHDRELTYSLSLPLESGNPGPRELVYQLMHQSIRRVLVKMGVLSIPYRVIGSTKTKPATIGLGTSSSEPFLCFQRRTGEDLICAGYKILGSAQRRVRGGVLQHGSLLLRTSRFARVLPGIEELTNRSVHAQELVDQLSQEIGIHLGIRWSTQGLDEVEADQVQQIEAQRYAADSWTRRR